MMKSAVLIAGVVAAQGLVLAAPATKPSRSAAEPKREVLEGFVEIDPHAPALPPAGSEQRSRSVDERWERAQMAMPSNARAREAYERGLDLANDGDDQGAIAAFTGAYDLDRSFTPALRARADARLRLGAWNPAIADLSALVRAAPNDADLLAMRGRALLRQHDADAAWRDLSAAVSLDDGDASLWADLAGACLLRDDRYGAVDAATRALQVDPDNSSALRARGMARVSLGKHREALADLSLALEHGDADPAALAARAGAREALGDIRGAIEDATASLEADPSQTLVRMQRALNSIRIGEHESARADCETIAASASASPQSRAAAQRILDRLSRTVASVEEIERARSAP